MRRPVGLNFALAVVIGVSSIFEIREVFKMGDESENLNLKVISPNVQYTDEFIVAKYKYSITEVKIENNELQVSK